MSAHPLAGSVDLAVPEDMFDLIAPDDDGAARDKIADLVGRVFPRMKDAAQASMTDAVMSWRAMMREQGVVYHGLATVPAEQSPTAQAVHWHVLAGVVDLPAHDTVDMATLLSRHLGQQLTEDRAYVERFDTTMGWGVGLITEVDLVQQDDAEPAHVVGLSAAVSAPHGGTRGLLVVGLCLDLHSHLQMSAVVAAMAAASVVRAEDDLVAADA